jgi:hypothetical protein
MRPVRAKSRFDWPSAVTVADGFRDYEFMN